MPDDSCGKYGENAPLTLQNQTFSNEEIANLNLLMLEIDWLAELHESTILSKQEDQPDISITKFLKAIFAAISFETGGIYNLSLISPHQDNKLYVIDTNYTGTEETIEPYIFNAFKSDSIVRSLNVDSKLPDRMATSMYIAGRGSDATGTNSDVATNITGAEIEDDPDALNLALEVLNEVNIQLAESGYEIEAIREGEDALRKYKIKAADKNWNEDVLYPISLNITIDGIAGFRFGNVIGTNWLPAKYRDKAGDLKIVFVITNVTHDISGNDWSTTLQTQCRMKL